MDGSIVFFYFISAAISLIVLVCFFVLVSNVNSIRNTFRVNNEDFGPSFNLYLAIGDKKAARELLLDRIKQDDCFKTAFFYRKDIAESEREILMKKFGKRMALVDLTIDFEEVDKTMEFIYGKEK